MITGTVVSYKQNYREFKILQGQYYKELNIEITDKVYDDILIGEVKDNGVMKALALLYIGNAYENIYLRKLKTVEQEEYIYIDFCIRTLVNKAFRNYNETVKTDSLVNGIKRHEIYSRIGFEYLDTDGGKILQLKSDKFYYCHC